MMISKRPYFLKAWYDWISDNELTAHIVVDATLPKVKVPKAHVQEGKITLNISPQAVDNFRMHYMPQFPRTLYALEFEAGFQAGIEQIYIPVQAIEAIYAAENGQGTPFSKEAGEQFPESKSKPEFFIVE